MSEKGNKKKKKNANKQENINEQLKSSNPGLYLDFKINFNDFDLFDFSNVKNTNTPDITNGSNIFYCKDKKNKIFTEYKQCDIKDEIIFRARKSKKNYYELIYPIVKMSFSDCNEIEKLNKRMWYVFKSQNPENKYENKNEDYYLSENDIIKFGTVKYEIIKMHKSSSSEKVENNIEKDLKFGSIFEKFYPEFNNENETCNICDQDNSSEDNPKVKLCKCHIYMHYECLKNTLKKKIKEYEKVTKYTCEEFYCKECKSPYPLKFYIKFDDNSDKENEKLLIDLKIPEKCDYIILENLNEKKKSIKNVFVVKLEGGEITIGKNNNNNIIIDDKNNQSGVSKEHCFLKYDKDKGLLTIIDKSTYGTSVLIKSNAKIENNKELYFQNGKFFIKAKYIEGEVKKEKSISKVDSDEKNTIFEINI